MERSSTTSSANDDVTFDDPRFAARSDTPARPSRLGRLRVAGGRRLVRHGWEVASFHVGVTRNVLWAPTDPIRSAYLLLTIFPLEAATVMSISRHHTRDAITRA